MIKSKNNAYDQSVKLKMELVKIGALTQGDFDTYKKELEAEGWKDYCWLSNNYGKLRMLNGGLYGLKEKQQLILSWLSKERWVERRHRYFPIEQEWKRRYNKYNGIAKNNKRLTRWKTNSVKKERRPVEKREKQRKMKK